MSIQTQREAWAGVDAYVGEIADFVEVVADAETEHYAGETVEQLLPQAVLDAAALQQCCLDFVDILQLDDNAQAAQTLLAGAESLRMWLETLLVRVHVGDVPGVAKDIVQRAHQKQAHQQAIYDAAAACAAQVSLTRTFGHGDGAAIGDDDDGTDEGSDEGSDEGYDENDTMGR